MNPFLLSKVGHGVIRTVARSVRIFLRIKCSSKNGSEFKISSSASHVALRLSKLSASFLRLIMVRLNLKLFEFDSEPIKNDQNFQENKRFLLYYSVSLKPQWDAFYFVIQDPEN